MNRRRFLLASAGSAAAGLLVPACSTPGRRRSPPVLRLSTSSIHFKGLAVEDACARIAALGFEGVDLWSAYEKCPHLDDVRDRLGAGGFQSLLARHRLSLVGFSTYVGGFGRYAELLGQSGGGLAIQGSAGPCRPAELDAAMRRFFTELQPLADLAGRHGACLAIENHGQSLLDGLDSFRAFVGLNPYPTVGLALAPYHIQALGESVPEAIRIAGPQLRFFYAWQNAPGTGQLPGLGPSDLTPWMAALREIGYPGHVNPFMHGHLEPDAMAAALRQSVDAIQDCWHRA